MRVIGKGVKHNRAAVAAVLALFLAAPAAVPAQDRDLSELPPSSADSLNLPTDITIYGKATPGLHKATAIVNGTIITDTDIDQRLALVLLANAGRVDKAEEGRLRLQVLRNLIDETLQIQEAKANEITVESDEIEQTFTRISRNFAKAPKDFAKYLHEVGSSESSMKRQIEGELAWRRLLSRRVEPFISVGEEEVRGVMARLNASKGATEYHIGEIFLSGSTPETLANADKILSQLRNGASFAAYARQFSEASTAAVGGDLGWVRSEQLPAELSEAALSMQPGQVSAPIPIGGGYSILALIDRRQVLMADPRDAVLSLKQISIRFPAGETEAQAGPKVERFAKALQGMTGCGNAEAVAATFGAEVIDNDQVRVRDLPPQLQQIMVNLQVGQSTPPFGSLREGVRSLVLCGRDDPQTASGPSFEQIQSQIEEERVNRRARRYLRDLRRDAVIEYR